jgi:hypothetical protein
LKYFLLFTIIKPPVTLDITLSLPVEKIEKSPNDHKCLSLNLLHKQCAQSSMINILFFSAISMIFFISEAFQKVCCIIITLVFFVIFFFKSFVSNQRVFPSISEYITFAQLCITEFVTDIQV